MVVLDDHKATMSPGAVFLRKSPGAVTAALQMMVLSMPKKKEKLF
jgi:hypothetical protein